MLRVWVQPDSGLKYELTQNSEYDVINIEGLNPVGATINTYKIGASDGEHYNSSYVNTRNIVLYIVPKNNNATLEHNRLEMYSYFQPKKKVRLYFQHDSRDVFIDGYVETVEISLYSEQQQFQISIICPQPYFKSTEKTELVFSQTTDTFEFPFAIDTEGVEFSTFAGISAMKCSNVGDVDTGLIITITATDIAYGFTVSIDGTTNFTLNTGLQLNSGDTLTINTNRGEKSVTKVDSNGNVTNCINYVTAESQWLTLTSGSHEISKSVYLGYENATFSVEFYNLYIGL